MRDPSKPQHTCRPDIIKKKARCQPSTLVLHDRAKWIVLGSTSSSLPNRCLFHYGLSSEMKTDKI